MQISHNELLCILYSLGRVGCMKVKFIIPNRFSSLSSLWGTHKSSLKILQQRVSLSKLVLCLISCNYNVHNLTVGCSNVNRLSLALYITLYDIKTNPYRQSHSPLIFLNIWLDIWSEELGCDHQVWLSWESCPPVSLNSSVSFQHPLQRCATLSAAFVWPGSVTVATRLLNIARDSERLGD